MRMWMVDVYVNVCECECAWVCSNAIDVYVADVGAWQCLGARIEAAT